MPDIHVNDCAFQNACAKIFAPGIVTGAIGFVARYVLHTTAALTGDDALITAFATTTVSVQVSPQYECQGVAAKIVLYLP